MRILVYGFRPYATYTENITENLLARIPEQHGLVKQVFDVRFDPVMFNKVFERTRPQVIIGSGQHPRARKLRIERKARNLRIKPDRELIPISRSGPQDFLTSLDWPASTRTTVSYDAGTYVCNYSMYLAAQYCDRTGARFGFVHVPKDYDLRKLTAYIQKTIARVRAMGQQD